MYKEDRKNTDSEGTLIGFFKNSKRFLYKLVVELLKLAMTPFLGQSGFWY